MKLGIARNFDDANERCQELGGQLAIIYDQVSHDAIFQQTEGCCKHVFLDVRNSFNIFSFVRDPINGACDRKILACLVTTLCKTNFRFNAND